MRPVKLDDDTSELLAQDEFLLQEGFAALTADHPNLWCSVGLRYRSIKYGTLGLAMMTATTLAEALEIACRYQALTYSLINYRYALAPNGACALIGETDGMPPHLHEFSQHRDLGAIMTLINDLVVGDHVLERITVAAPPPCNWATIKSHFYCPVEFNADRTQWICLPGSTNRALPLGDSDLQQLYNSRCEALLGRAHANASVTQRLTALLNARGEDILGAGQAARELALSERTLHRRLADEGTRFSIIVDDARYQRARELLANRRMTIEGIAFAVGFSEPSSFSRAFKRWAGVGALEYRRRMNG